MANSKPMDMETPGNKKTGGLVRVRVVDPEWPVRQAASKAPFLVPLLDESGINFMEKSIKERIVCKRDSPIVVTGDRSLGKSTIIAKIAKKIDSSFDLDKIAFWLEDFEEIWNKNPYADPANNLFPQVDLDEAGHALFGEEWFKEEQRIIAKQLIINRIKRQTMWMAVPRLNQLNNQVRNMPWCWIHVTEPTDYVQGYAIVRFAPSKDQSEFYTDKLWLPKFTFIFTEESGPWWDRYEEKKIKFVNEANDKAKRRSSDKWKRVAKAAAIYLHRQEKKTLEQTGEILGLPNQRVSDLVLEDTVNKNVALS